uniref:fimbrillin family protein n=1 Tax=Alistipes sp. TaxID=1872444 RepID=UPI004056A847
MKRFFLFAAAAMVSLSSCVQSEEVYTGQVQELGFKSAVTRGIIQSNDDMTYPIAVSAVLDNTEDGTENYISYFDFLAGKFVYDSASSLWKGSPARYWPTSGTMNFLALCPYPSQGSPINTTYAANGKVEKVAFGTIDNNLKEQHDVLFSDLLVVEAPQTAAQSLFFHHAYAQLNVTFKKTDSAAKVVVKSVATIGVNLSGVLNVTPGEAVVDSDNSRTGGSTASWTSGLPVTRHFLKAGADSIEAIAIDQELEADNTYAPTPLLVIPNAQTKIQIVYTIDGFEHTYVHELTGDWLMGHKYTYNYTINVNEIIFDCTVEDWVPVDGGSITI